MPNNFAQHLADMANAAEAAILKQMTSEARDWWFSLPRETRIQVAIEAAEATLNNIEKDKAAA